MQLLPGVYLLSGHAYGLHPNVYGITLPEKKGLVLIDTGLDINDVAMIKKNMAVWNLTDLPVRHALITHAHFDHAGNARYFQENGAVIMAGEGDAQGIAAGDERTINYAYSMPFPSCKVDRILHDGDTLNLFGLEIHCHLLPGHSGGSVVYETLLCGKRLIFTGDFLMSAQDCAHGKPGISVGEDYNHAAYLSSMKKLRAVSPDAVFGGHGQAALEKGAFLIDSAYRNMLVERVFSSQ